MTKSEMLLRAASDFKAVVTAHNHVSIAALPLTVLTNILGSNSWDTWDTCNRSARLYFRPEIDSSSSYSSKLSALFSRPDSLSPGCGLAESYRRKGTDLSLLALEAGKATNNLEIVSIEEFEIKDGKKSYRLVWKLIDWSGWLMKSRRVDEFVEKSGKMEYDSWNEMAGLLAWLLRWTSDVVTLMRFDEAFESLKVYLESNRCRVEARVTEGEEAG